MSLEMHKKLIVRVSEVGNVQTISANDSHMQSHRQQSFDRRRHFAKFNVECRIAKNQERKKKENVEKHDGTRREKNLWKCKKEFLLMFVSTKSLKNNVLRHVSFLLFVFLRVIRHYAPLFSLEFPIIFESLLI